MTQNTLQKCSSLKKIRQDFSRSIRKSQIQKIQKQKRQKQMRYTNPIAYIQKLKKQLTTEKTTYQIRRESIEFLAQNIKNQQFADIVQKEQVIQIIVLKTIEVIDPWVKSQGKSQNSKYPPKKCIRNENGNYFGRCECIDCQQSSTSFSEVNMNEEIQIDRPSNMNGITSIVFRKSNNQFILILNELIQFLNYVFDCYWVINQSQSYRETNQPISSSFDNTLTKFHSLFMNTPQIFEGLILDLIDYRKSYLLEQNVHMICNNLMSSQKFQLIFKIINYLSKTAQICYFQQNHWTILFEIYSRHFQNLSTQIKQINENINEIKELFIVASKSYIMKEILIDSKNIISLNKLIYPWVKSINQTLKNENQQNKLSRNTLTKFLNQQFQLAVSILSFCKFIQKHISEDIKLILGQILTVSKALEQEQFSFQNQIKFVYISPQIIRNQESDLLRRTKIYAQKLIQILYLQMELSEDDLYKISKAQPSLKCKIEQIIDADMY